MFAMITTDLITDGKGLKLKAAPVKEKRCKTDSHIFTASNEQSQKARCKTLDEFWRLHRRSLEDPDGFWREFASEFFWKTPLPEKILNYNFDVTKGPVFIEWMKGATTNICYNALDRNIELGHGDKIAFYWEGNDPQDYSQITYKELHTEVCRFANVLKSKGVKKGDMVALYMPMIVELAIAMFACARIGAVHSVVFGGYSSESLADRILDGNCQILVTADGVWRGKKLVHLKNIVDKTLEICRNKEHRMRAVIVVEHQMNLVSVKNSLMGVNGVIHKKSVCVNGYELHVSWDEEVDFWWHEEMEKASDVCEPVWVDAEDTLFTLYTRKARPIWEALSCNLKELTNLLVTCKYQKKQDTLTDQWSELFWRHIDEQHHSGSTGKPKGCVHATGGYMVYGAVTFKYVFDYFPGDIFFCTGDIGWLTGHTYIVYGSLLNAATCIIYEGVPTHPNPGRYWAIVEKYGVTHFYTAPTAIRTLMKFDDCHVTKHNRSTLRVLGSVGEPINRDAWMWYHDIVGEGRCPIVDTFWQTETVTKIPCSVDFLRSELNASWEISRGGHILTPMPFCTPLKPGCATLPFFGVEPAILDEKGNEIEGPGKGYFVIKRPWPAIMRTVHRNHERFQSTYFRKYPGYYFTGDGGRRDEDGHYWVTGRVDDMLNVSGHLLSTLEIEAALVDHKSVAEIAVVPQPHPVKGECLYCFVVLKEGYDFDENIVQDLKQQVVRRIGPFASPEYFHHASALPKTRSGKTVRRILKKIASDDHDLGDLSTLLDEQVIEELFASTRIYTGRSEAQK